MNFLLFYKGSYTATLRGPEMRYVALARELVAAGHKVTICGKADGVSIPVGANFVLLSKFFSLLVAFFRADVILLHGGGPIILMLAIFSAFLNKKIVLDGYVPHWIELDALVAAGGVLERVKLLVKSYFNVARAFLGGLIFDLILVANKRQLDLFRGIISPFMVTRSFSRIVIVPFGCEETATLSKSEGRVLLSSLGEVVRDDDFLIGWLGGTYGWFDLDFLLSAISTAMKRNKKIKIAFFGVSDESKLEFLSRVDQSVQGNVLFMPWVDFSTRLQYWSGFDISLVWGGQSYENDYASRTRNFDCLSLGLPIVQNEDDEWGGRLRETGAGVVSTELSLAADLYRLSISPDDVLSMQKAMEALAKDFHWSNFAESIVGHVGRPVMSRMRRLLGLFGFFLALPALLAFFVFNMISTIFYVQLSDES